MRQKPVQIETFYKSPLLSWLPSCLPFTDSAVNQTCLVACPDIELRIQKAVPVTVVSLPKTFGDGLTLEVDDNKEDKDGGEEVHQVGQVLSVESFVQSSNFVLFGGEKVEESNDGAFEFSSSADVDCSWRERLPDDSFANVGGDEEGDSGAETVAFGEELVEKKDNHSSDEELDDDQRADSSSHLSGIAVHAGQNVDDSLAKSHDHTEELLSAGEKSSELICKNIGKTDGLEDR